MLIFCVFRCFLQKNNKSNKLTIFRNIRYEGTGNPKKNARVDEKRVLTTKRLFKICKIFRKLYYKKTVIIRVRYIAKPIIFILRFPVMKVVKPTIKITIYIMWLKLMQVSRPFAQKKLLQWIEYLRRKNFLIFWVHPNLSSNLNSTYYKKAQQYRAFFNNAFMNLVNYLKCS